MSQRAKFHHAHHGRRMKERCRQVDCGGELRELRPGFGYPEHIEGARTARRAGLHGTPVKLGLLGRCDKCGTHVNIRTVFGVEIDGESVNETVNPDEPKPPLRHYSDYMQARMRREEAA